MAILIEPPANWGNLQGKPIIFSDDQVDWDEIQGKPNTFPPGVPLGGTKISISLGNNVNSAYAPSSIEIPSDNAYGGYYDFHSGALLACGDNWGWGSQRFKVYIASGWGEYNSPPCLIASTSIFEVPGIFKGASYQALSMPNNPSGLDLGSFYRDENGFVKVVV